jgi:hypothetical protein
LEIKVEGCPKPELKWYKQGVEITPCEAFQIEEIYEGVWALTLHDLPENLEEIVAVAVNPLGMASDALRVVTEEGKFHFYFDISNYKSRKSYNDVINLLFQAPNYLNPPTN